MRYEIFYEPITHIVIDEFFDTHQYEKIFHSIHKLEPLMTAGDVLMNQTIDSSEHNEKFKKNYNLWLYDQTSENIDSQKIIDLVENTVWSFVDIFYSTKDSLFQTYPGTNFSKILLSKYVRGGHYEWHIDTMLSITGNILLSKDDVLGGDFVLKNHKEEEKLIEFKTNRCIFFPSLIKHKVTKVENDCSRYSIQYFSNYIHR